MSQTHIGEIMTSQFNYPWQYNFPPFFTIQPNIETRHAQLEAWRSLILDFCRHHNIPQLHLRDWLNKPPFCNDTIERRLSLESLRLIIGSLIEKRYAEWTDAKDKETCLIFSRPPEQWAQLIYDHVKDKSLYNTVQTFYELLEGDSTQGCEFHQLDETIFLRALRVLEKQGKAAVIELDGSKGVKFV